MLEEAPGADAAARIWRDDKGRPWLVVPSWGHVDGRIEVVGMTFTSSRTGFVDDAVESPLPGYQDTDPPPVRLSAEVWHQLPIGSVSAELRQAHLDGLESAGWEPSPAWKKLPRYDVGETPPGGWTAEAVAGVYVAAQERGEHPTKAVAEALGISRAAASMRVSRARAEGFLPPTSKGTQSTTPPATKEGDRG